jgi:transcriptional regulator with XRE-family HTH domain
MARRGNPEQNPTLRGRRLAAELLRRREATGMSREEVARQLKWSTSTLFRIGTGRNRPQPGNVRMLLELYGVTGPERDGLIQLTRQDAEREAERHAEMDEAGVNEPVLHAAPGGGLPRALVAARRRSGAVRAGTRRGDRRLRG